MRDLAFPSLFTPTSAADFLAQWWSRRPLYTAGAAWRTQLRFTLADLQRGLPHFSRVKAQFLREGRHREMAIEGRQAQDLHDAGLSICVTAIDEQVPELAEFATRIQDELRFAGDVLLNCYWSPAGGGFATHFDDQHVFILQLEGSKRWSISETPACDAPPGNLVDSPEESASFRKRHPEVAVRSPAESSFVEHMLKPGDCLYLPPGTWHRTMAGEFSLALTLTLAHVRLERLMSSVARTQLERSASWREALPVDAASSIGMTPEWRRHLEARITEFRRFAETLTPELLAEEWLEATLGRATASTSDSASGDDRPFGDGDILIRRHRLELCPAKDRAGDDVVVLLWSGGRCEVPAEYGPFCRRLASATRFSPEEARRWTVDATPLEEDETRDVLVQLVRSGLLRRA